MDMKHIIQLFPTLILSEEVYSALASSTMSEKRKMSEAFAYLDAFGWDKSFLGRRCKRNGGNLELVVRLNEQNEVAFIVNRVDEGSFKYEVTAIIRR